MKHALWQPILSFIICFILLGCWSWKNRDWIGNANIILFVALGYLHGQWFSFVQRVKNKA